MMISMKCFIQLNLLEVVEDLLWMYMVIIRYNIEIYCNCRALPETQAV